MGRWPGAAPIDSPAGDVAVVFSEPIAWVSSRGCVYTSQPIKAQSNASATTKRARVKITRVLSGRPRENVLIKVAHGKLFKSSPLRTAIDIQEQVDGDSVAENRQQPVFGGNPFITPNERRGWI